MLDEQKRIIEAFSRDLDAGYHKAGIRSYTELANRSEKIKSKANAKGIRVTHVSRSAAYKILTGQRERLPSWDQVAQLIRVFHEAAADRYIDPAAIGSLTEWKTKYEEAAAALRAVAASSPSRVNIQLMRIEAW